MTRLAFGTSVSSSTFNRCARTAIFGEEIYDPNIRVYVDDVKIETSSFEDHLTKLIRTVKNVAESGMSSLDKMTLFHSTLKYLGFNIKRGVIRKGDKYKLFFSEFNSPTRNRRQNCISK